jgi:hypothetical protein
VIIVSPRLKLVGDSEVEVWYEYGLDASSQDSELPYYLYGHCYDHVYHVTHGGLVQQSSFPRSHKPRRRKDRYNRSPSNGFDENLDCRMSFRTPNPISVEYESLGDSWWVVEGW